MEQKGEHQEALQDYEAAIKIKKDNSEVLLSYALCLKEVGRVSNCLSTLNSALYCPNAEQFKSKILA